ncbi:MAG TPA: endonuclease domain-containing protein [Xanthobacteraceae bacterium]
MTNAERKLWWHLNRLPNPNAHFRRQATIGQYYADFACHHHRLVIEVDGGGHAEDQQIAADARRTAFLNARGYRVLRFWNNAVFNQIEGVMSTIHQALIEAAAKREGELGASVVPHRAPLRGATLPANGREGKLAEGLLPNLTVIASRRDMANDGAYPPAHWRGGSTPRASEAAGLGDYTRADIAVFTCPQRDRAVGRDHHA